jgi:Cu+-exporting ATPase
MTDPLTLAEAYLNAFYAGDPRVRDMLADDFHFSGPSAHFHGADAFLRASSHAAAGTRTVEIEKLFASGSEVAAFYTLHLDHRVAQARVAERLRIEGDKVVASTLIMDTAPFLARSRTSSQELAIDPVCHMEVDKVAPAATREHDGRIYYFCSTGCAEAFEKRPEDYLAA